MPKFKKSSFLDSSDEDEPPTPEPPPQQESPKKRKKFWDDSSDEEEAPLAKSSAEPLHSGDVASQLLTVGASQFVVAEPSANSRLGPDGSGDEVEGAGAANSSHGSAVNADGDDKAFDSQRNPQQQNLDLGSDEEEPYVGEAQQQILDLGSDEEDEEEAEEDEGEVEEVSPPGTSSEGWLARRASAPTPSALLGLSAEMTLPVDDSSSDEASGEVDSKNAAWRCVQCGCATNPDGSRACGACGSSRLASEKPPPMPTMPPPRIWAAPLQQLPSNRLKSAKAVAPARRARSHRDWDPDDLQRGDEYSQEDESSSDDERTGNDSAAGPQVHLPRRVVVPVAEWWVPPDECADGRVAKVAAGEEALAMVSWTEEEDGTPLSTEEWILKGRSPDLFGWLESHKFADSTPAALYAAPQGGAGLPPCAGKELASACTLAAQEGRLSVLRWLSRLPNFDPQHLFRGDNDSLAPVRSVVFAAARSGHVEVLRWLARCFGGGDLTVKHKDGSSDEYGRGGAQGRRLLLRAVRERTLVSTGEGGGFNPLLMAAWNGHLKAARWLFVHGADPAGACDLGRTPLFYARTQGHFGVVRWLLLNGGASTCLRARAGQGDERPHIDDALVRSGLYENLGYRGPDDHAVVSLDEHCQARDQRLSSQSITATTHMRIKRCAPSGRTSGGHLPRGSHEVGAGRCSRVRSSSFVYLFSLPSQHGVSPG